MCGIIFRFGKNKEKYTHLIDSLIELLEHRGPDDNNFYVYGKAIMIFTRLSIVDPNARQPILNKQIATMTNGEFYDYERQYDNNYEPITKCDSEILIPMYLKYGPRLFSQITHGKFASVIYDTITDDYVCARDRIGIIPLYYGYDKHNGFWISSELKVLEYLNIEPNIFQPGYYYYNGEFYPYYNYGTWSYNPNIKFRYEDLRNKLTKAVYMRIPPAQLSPRRAINTPTKGAVIAEPIKFACLLSGGLDSSLVASIASKYEKIHTFSIGFKDSTDLIAARKVADYLNSIHHEVVITIEDAWKAIAEVIYYLETYDLTTIRAATPMYLLAKHIHELGFKVVMSGEGADELFGGYAYFKHAPDPKEFALETFRKMRLLHRYDCLRANKALMAQGIEGRFPFLDLEFVEYIMQIHPKIKMYNNVEKRILREAFEGYLPRDILWRSKEQFSDGVGYSWISFIKEKSAEIVDMAENNFKINPPWTPEGLFYRQTFHNYYKSDGAARTVINDKSLACSTKKIKHWFKESVEFDPSGRSIY
jgi:asparagine synthase (glutamine-hydrolysing)